MARSELAFMARGELEDRLSESRRELLNLRFQKATGQLDNTARLGQVRREVARILTILREQDLGLDLAEAAPEPEPEPEPPARRRARRGKAVAAPPSDPVDETGDAGDTADDETEEEA